MSGRQDSPRDVALRCALRAFGVVFMLVYPLGMLWPSGWVWHGGMGGYYLEMICGLYAVLGVFLLMAAQRPAEHRSLIAFTAWSSIVHAGIMAVQATGDAHEHGHLLGDVPALVLVAVVLWVLAPPRDGASLPRS